MRTGLLLASILLVGAVIRALYLAELRGSPEFTAPALDAAFHDHWARALCSGDWSPPRFFPDPEIHTTPYFRPPAYPYFLAGVYALADGSALGARAVQMALGLVNVVLGFLLGRALFGPAVGLVTAAGMACCWTFPYFEGELLAPALLVASMLAMLLAWQRWWHRGRTRTAVAGGLWLGLLALGLPIALALVPVVWIWALWVARRRPRPGRLRGVLLGLPLGVAVAIAPATIRNLVVAGDFVLITSNAGVNFYIGNNEQADGHSARIPILDQLVALPGWTCFDQPAIARGVAALAGRPLRASEVSAWFTDRALEFVTGQPGKALALAARKAGLFWGPLEVANNRELEIARATSHVLRWLPGFPWILSLAIVGAMLLARELRLAPRDHRLDLSLLLGAVVLVYFAVHLPFFVAGRYRAPIAPLLLLFGAFGIVAMAGMLRQGRWRQAGAWAAAWLALLAAAHVPLVDYAPDPGRWHFQRGDAFRQNGDAAAAIAEYRLAIERARQPDPSPYNNLGAALLAQGRIDEAVACLQRAVQLAPRYLHAHANLALAYANSGRDELAREALQRQLQLDPQSVDASARLGGILLRLGRPAEAVPHLRRARQQVPADARIRYLYGVALIDAGQPEAGRSELEDLLRTGPHADACVVLAELAARAGDFEGATGLLRQALAHQPDHAGAAELLRRLQAPR